jgi:uncharacterized membrane protein
MRECFSLRWMNLIILLHAMHNTNIVLHIAIGTFGILIGLWIMLMPKGNALHQKRGRWFLIAIGGVVLTAIIGLTFFRYMPVFAVLTIVIGYQTWSGVRAIKNKQHGPKPMDALVTLLAVVLLSVAGYTLLNTPASQIGAPSMALKIAALSGGVLLLTYDTLRWTFPRHWHATLWQYEHTYKMIASVSGLVSAVTGNVIRVGQPWSQLLPILFFSILIVVEFWKIATRPTKTNFA